MSEKQDRGWKLYIGDTLIGTAYYHQADQPFIICMFQPTSAYAVYRPIFDEYAALVNNPSPEQAESAVGEYYESKIESLNLKLMPFGDIWPNRVAIVQIYNGNEAWITTW